MEKFIQVFGAKHNNLKNINVQFPVGKMSVITGPSGCGKSSLAFETLYAEGQRRYIESLSPYARQFLEQMPKPDVDKITNIPAAIALEQKNGVISQRNIIAIQTDLLDYFRLLFTHIGSVHCTKCGAKAKQMSTAELLDYFLAHYQSKKVYIVASITFEEMEASIQKGFLRFLKKGLNEYHLIEEEQLSLLQPNDTLFVIIDRFKVHAETDLQRVIESFEVAFRMENKAVGFFDPQTNQLEQWDQALRCTQCRHLCLRPHLDQFSFNHPLGACAVCAGFGNVLILDEAKIIPNSALTLKQGAIYPFRVKSYEYWNRHFMLWSAEKKIPYDIPYHTLSQDIQNLIWNGDKDFPGIVGFFHKLKKMSFQNLHLKIFIRRYEKYITCEGCHGKRLKKENQFIFLIDKSFPDLLDLSIDEAKIFFENQILHQSGVEEILAQIQKKLHALQSVGVGYLTLSRLTKTLSGGELQRINLATQLSSGLTETLYILDEPSIGLHASDTKKLLNVLADLRNQGNTLVLVEHDPEVILASDYVVELGPQAGAFGGEILTQNSLEKFLKNSTSITASFLNKKSHLNRKRKKIGTKALKIEKANCHNLQNLDVTIPLEGFVVITGVSGSGKSTLVNDVIYPSLYRLLYENKSIPVNCQGVFGYESLKDIYLLDQGGLVGSRRSNIATYIGAWEYIRKIFAQTLEAREEGLSASDFSFNIPGGRCEVCRGEGYISVDMHFMAPVSVPCEECEAQRFQQRVLNVKFQGKNIYDILNMTIDEVIDFFESGSVVDILQILKQVGLGYLKVGQSTKSLSGGEVQRLRIAELLVEKEKKNLSSTLLIFDEPTTGLHLTDIQVLLDIISKIVDEKCSVIFIEHNLHVIAQADWVIDMGPLGGVQGGKIVGQGKVEDLLKNPHSLTAKALQEYFS